MKRVLKTAAFFLMAISLNSCLAGRFMADYALKPTPHGVQDIERTRHKADSLLPGSTAWYDGLKARGILKDHWISGGEGVKLHACYVPAARPEEARGTAVVVHGYTDNHFVFLYLVRMYRDRLNYNVLFPDLQYHGYSGGDAIQMGWKDRLDLEKWIEAAHDIFQDDFMVLHGVSMGAATVMMASGDPLPDYVRCFVEDCGYTSAWDQFASTLKQRFRLPPFPLLNSASIVTRRRYGWGFKDASSVEQLHKCVKPMLFIHGDADDFVPFAHLEKNFRAKWHGYKEKWEVPGAVHANSYAKYPEEYTRRVENFLKTVHNMIEDGSIYDK